MTETSPAETARDALDAWRGALPDDLYAADSHLRELNRRSLSGTRLADLEVNAAEFGRRVPRVVAPLVATYERRDPVLESWDGSGRRVEHIDFDAAYHEAGAALWEAGVVANAAVAGYSFEQATLAYLAAYEGEMGHLCAATCTTGLIRALRRSDAPDLAERFLPGLTTRSYPRALRGAQFITEVQGGSDVGANVARAVAAGDGTYRISGEKWFCSVADADVFLLLARPDGAAAGTSGLGCFLVPRLVDGVVNGFSIRRLKDKLGTRSMASAEIDFDGAVGYPLALEGGFRLMVTAMLNTSRWLNAIGDVGIMRRAYTEAMTYAVHRRAFGRPIIGFPLVQRSLARMKAEWLAALYSTWHLTSLDEAADRAATGQEADADDVAFHRFLVNANKLAVSEAATGVVRLGIEVLGGNGTIESFSPLPRLLRDSIVFEQWEGTHNVLAEQVRRDLARLGLTGLVFDRIRRTLKTNGHPVTDRAGAALNALEAGIARCLEDEAHGEMHFRDELTKAVRILQVGLLAEAARTAEAETLGGELLAAAGLLFDEHVATDARPADDAGFAARITAVLGEDTAGIGTPGPEAGGSG